VEIPFPPGNARGVLAAFGSLYVMAADTGRGHGIHRLEDTDGDGQYDRHTRLHLIPGGSAPTVSRMAVSPDGKRIFFGCGPGASLPETLRGRRVAEPGGVFGGFICSMNPDGGDLELFCHGLRAGFDLGFDWGSQLFACEPEPDADERGDFRERAFSRGDAEGAEKFLKGTEGQAVVLPASPSFGGKLGVRYTADRSARLVHCVSGGDYGARNGSAPEPEDSPDILPGLLDLGPGKRAGLVSGQGAKFPGRSQRALFARAGNNLWTVQLQPKGATYLAVKEPFLQGQPLADAVVHPIDGMLYLAVGGSPDESAVYRVRYAGDASTVSEQAPPLDEEFRMRDALEQWHRAPVDAQRVLGGAWPYLRHSDRRLRYAARVAIERLPTALWAEKVWAERHPGARVEAVIALARVSGAASREVAPQDAAPVQQENAALQGRLFEALGELAGRKLNAAQQIAVIRAYDRVITCLGRPDPATRAGIAERLAPWSPAEDAVVARELAAFLENLRREAAQR
jgi:hypothetical protein